MMINKKLSVLAAAIVATSAQASFESDSLTFVAVNSSGDTYVQDLGDVSILDAAFSIGVDTAALGALGTYEWTIVGANSTGTPLAAPPGNYAPTADTGVISATAGTDTSVSTVATGALVASERTAVNTWLADVNAADGDNNGSVSIAGGNAGEFLPGMQVAHQGGAMQSGNGDVNLLGIYQAAGSNTTAPDVSILNSNPVSFNGSTVSAVPVPAAAWLFGSALAGLTVIRRRK
jgi:hypothetical protein